MATQFEALSVSATKASRKQDMPQTEHWEWVHDRQRLKQFTEEARALRKIFLEGDTSISGRDDTPYTMSKRKLKDMARGVPCCDYLKTMPRYKYPMIRASPIRGKLYAFLEDIAPYMVDDRHTTVSAVVWNVIGALANSGKPLYCRFSYPKDKNYVERKRYSITRYLWERLTIEDYPFYPELEARVYNELRLDGLV
jgi:hypothetical protein